MTDTVASYRASSGQGVLQTVDFSTVAGQYFSFFQLHDPSGVERIKTLLATPPLRQTLVTSTYVDGRLMLVMRGDTLPSDMISVLSSQGESLEKVVPEKPFDAWKVRSILGFGGQTLQLISAFLRPERGLSPGKGIWKRLDTGVSVFAATNLTANAINLVYDKGEQVQDVHQLRYLKQRMNRELSPHLNAGEAAPSIDDNRQALRPQDEHHRPLDKAKGFLERHSVAVGELGLRYLGAVGLAFPARWWKSSLSEGRFPRMDPSNLRVYTGLSSILGKTVALTSKIPDPYNPKPYTLMDRIREKFSFLSGGLIEVTSFAVMAYDAFFNSSGKNADRGLRIGGKSYRDWLGGIGASLFTLGYVVRSWAHFGERKVNMGELYAHTSDTLAQTPLKKMPQLLANTAASLAEHFKEKPGLDFATIYTNLANDLAKFHTLELSNKPIRIKEKTDMRLAQPTHEKPLNQVPHSQIKIHGAQLESPTPNNTLAVR